MRSVALSVVFLGGCYINAADRDQAKDRDRDGFFAAAAGGSDCNDNNPTIHPGHFESCLDDVDADCDGALCPLRAEVSLDALAPLLDLADDTLDLFGAGLLGGDVDGDDVVDLVISAPGSMSSVGSVLFLAGPLTAELALGAPEAMPLLWGETDAIDLRAEDMADLDGDGWMEVVLTAKIPRGTVGERGDATHDLIHYIVQALPQQPESITDVALRIEGGIWGERESRTPHRTAQAVGDQSGDGRAELMLRAPLSGAGESGVVYLLSGLPLSVQDAASAAWLTIEGAVPGDHLGEVGRGTSDLDGDGVAEVIVGAMGADLLGTDLFGTIPDVGAVSIFSLSGSTGGVLSAEDADVTILGAYAEAPIQEAFAVGDTDGDGLAELAVFLQTGAGQLALFRSLATAPARLPVLEGEVRLLGSLADEFTSSFGRDVVSRDVDDDGLADLLVTASLEPLYAADDETVLGVGAHYLFFGPVSGVQSPDHAAARWKAGQGDLTPATPLLVDADADGALDMLLGFGGNGSGASGRVYWFPDPFSAL